METAQKAILSPYVLSRLEEQLLWSVFWRLWNSAGWVPAKSNAILKSKRSWQGEKAASDQ
jgi:hypothetical protein